jgi:hypothetical protein
MIIKNGVMMGLIKFLKRVIRLSRHKTRPPVENQREKSMPNDASLVSTPSQSNIAEVSHNTQAVTTAITTPADAKGTKLSPIIQSFYFVEDKIEHRGEDASPICTLNESRGLIAVFDGMGGSGAKKYKNAQDEEFTGAYLGSRFARDFVANWYINTYSTAQHPGITTSELTNLKLALVNDLSKKLIDYTSPSTAVMSKMRRTLPSTMASVFFEAIDSSCQYDVVWAGDSRAYRLHMDGLQQLTIDDTSDTGTLTLADFMQDSPMNNCISIDQEFRFNHQRFTSTLPLILCVATDGCFGYLPSPIHFEHLLLDTLMQTNTPDEWSAQIARTLKPIAADDYSMSLICLGWPDFKSIQHTLQPRYTLIQRMVMEFDHIRTTIQQVNTQIEHLTQEQAQHKAKLEEMFSAYWQNYHVPVIPPV